MDDDAAPPPGGYFTVQDLRDPGRRGVQFHVRGCSSAGILVAPGAVECAFNLKRELGRQ